MSRHHHVLDDLQLRRWVAAKEPLSRSDGDGLTFTLSEFGMATWVLPRLENERAHIAFELTAARIPHQTKD